MTDTAYGGEAAMTGRTSTTALMLNELPVDSAIAFATQVAKAWGLHEGSGSMQDAAAALVRGLLAWNATSGAGVVVIPMRIRQTANRVVVIEVWDRRIFSEDSSMIRHRRMKETPCSATTGPLYRYCGMTRLRVL